MYEMLYILKDMQIEAVIMDVDQSLLVSDGEPHISTVPTTALFKEAGVEVEEDGEFDPEKEFSPLVHFVSLSHQTPEFGMSSFLTSEKGDLIKT